MFNNTYLHLLRQKNRKLFYAACAFILLTLLINATKNEITPFYVWSMYSAPAPQSDTFPVFTLQYNNGQVFNEPHTWRDHTRMMFFYPIDYYTNMMDHAGEPDALKMKKGFEKIHLDPASLSKIYNTPEQIKAYPYWLKQYMQANTGIKMDSISVYRKWVRYSESGRVYPVKSELLFKL